MYRSENSEKGGERESEGLPNGEKESAEDEDEENGVWGLLLGFHFNLNTCLSYRFKEN